jgi:hypothetical protein
MIHTLAATAVALPDQIKAAIAIGVLYLVRLVLAGRVPDQWLTELAGAITAAIITLIQLLLGLIPSQFDAIVAAVLQLIVVLLGGVLLINGYRLMKHSLRAKGLQH